ncbi:MAG: hypothetical protein ACM3X5_03865, partial [Bacillota bacterium]
MIRLLLRTFVASLLALLPLAAMASLPQLPPLPQLEQLEEALKLTPAQKVQYDAAVAATKRLLMGTALIGMEMRERLKAELDKPRPDLGALADMRDSLVEQTRPLRREARDEWLKLYQMLNDDQVATLKQFL